MTDRIVKTIKGFSEPIDFFGSFFLFVYGPDPLESEPSGEDQHTEALQRLLGRPDIKKTYIFSAGDWPAEDDVNGIARTIGLLPGMREEIYRCHKLASITGVSPRMRVVWFEGK